MLLRARVRVEELAVRGMRHLTLSLIAVRDPAQQKQHLAIQVREAWRGHEACRVTDGSE